MEHGCSGVASRSTSRRRSSSGFPSGRAGPHPPGRADPAPDGENLGAFVVQGCRLPRIRCDARFLCRRPDRVGERPVQNSMAWVIRARRIRRDVFGRHFFTSRTRHHVGTQDLCRRVGLRCAVLHAAKAAQAQREPLKLCGFTADGCDQAPDPAHERALSREGHYLAPIPGGPRRPTCTLPGVSQLAAGAAPGRWCAAWRTRAAAS